MFASILALLFFIDFMRVIRRFTVTLESQGDEKMESVAMTNGKSVHHLSPGGGVHVVGIAARSLASEHVGYLEDFNRIEKLAEIDTLMSKMARRFRYVGVVTNGGTHHKPALSRIRDDVAIELGNPGEKYEFSVVDFFKKYDMGKFLSAEHGCCRGYIMVYDTLRNKKMVEITGAVGSKLVHTVEI